MTQYIEHPQSVTLTNKRKSLEKPETINCGEIPAERLVKFFESLMLYDPKTSDGDNNCCGFNVYYGGFVSYARPYSITELHTYAVPCFKEDKEIVIEIVPLTTHKCGSWANYHCPTCLKKGECESPFIKQHVGMLLFPDKYSKQR